MTLLHRSHLAAAAALALFPTYGACAQGVVAGGFLGTYYANPSFAPPGSFQRRDVRIDFAWPASGAGGSPSPEFATVGQQGFSVSWTGSIVPATSETYTFLLATSGSVDLSIRQTGTAAWTPLVSDAGTGQRQDQAQFALTAGQSYDLMIDYSNPSAQGTMQLQWGSPTVPMADITPAAPLGINIGFAGADDPNMMFADAAKQALPFQALADQQNAAQPAAVDGNGWPAEDATLPIWTRQPEASGTYQLSFTGEAQVIDWKGTGSFSAGGQSYGATLPLGIGYNPSTNVTTATWTVPHRDGGTAAWLGFANTHSSPAAAVNSGVSGVSLMRPTGLDAATSHPAGELFNTEFKALIGNFTVIRAMDYLATMGNAQKTWADRSTPAAASQYQPIMGYGWQGKGGAWEYLVALANETGKDLWINIPAEADDTYVTQLAQLLAYGSDGTNPYPGPQATPAYPPLNSNLKVYVEYANELWDAYNPQHRQSDEFAAAEVAAGNSPLTYDGTTDQPTIAKRRIAERTKQISDLFRTVWGDAAMLTRIRPVLEWRYGDQDAVGLTGLSFLENYYDNADGQPHVPAPVPVKSYLWGGGGGWYSGVNNPGAGSISAAYASGLSMSTIGTTQPDAHLAQAFGLVETGYEGGFYVGSGLCKASDSASTPQLAANLAPQAAGFERQSIDLFYELGGRLPLVFTSAGSACGIAYPTIHEQNTPKLAGIQQALGAPHPPAQIGVTIPATLSLQQIAVASPSDARAGTLGGAGSFVDWTLNVPQAGNYTATLNGSAAGIVMFVDGTATPGGTWQGPLSAGLHGIRVTNTLQTPVNVSGLTVAAAP